MSIDDQTPEVTQNPSQFFEAIGTKVESLAPATNGDAADEDQRTVEEIESLCMNCGENVSRPPPPRMSLLAADLSSAPRASLGSS